MTIAKLLKLGFSPNDSLVILTEDSDGRSSWKAIHALVVAKCSKPDYIVLEQADDGYGMGAL